MNLSTAKAAIRLFVVSSFILLMSFSKGVVAQTAARPDRGFMPNGSYSVSDIEQISLQNGNLGLTIPLASLPPIAGGNLSWTINAHYNSKIWNINRQEYIGERSDGSNVYYVVDTPELSDQANWRISGQYEIDIREASFDFAYQLPPVADEPDYSLMVNYNWYRVVLRMPDGAEHELRPLDYSPFAGGKEFLYGYYNATPYTHGAMRYYSFDGSYLFATVTSYNNWTVYLPNGTKVVQTTDGIQRIQDTNGNKIKIYTDANGTHYQDEQTGREIRYKLEAGNQGRVYYKTVGNVEKYIAINFGESTVQGQLYRVNDWIPYQFNFNPCTHHQEIYTAIPVIREIVLPQTEPGVTRKFTFTYDSDSTETASNPLVRFSCSGPSQTYVRTASKGWGFLSRIETPSGAKIDYKFDLNSTHLPFGTDELADVSITEKKVDHDGTIDTWTYAIGDTGGQVTNPDGSTVAESTFAHFGGMGSAFGKSGLSYRSTRPFTKIERHWTHLAFSGASMSSPNGNVDFNSVVDFEYTTLTDASGNNLKMSAKAFQYDFNGNLKQTTEYDWFDPALVSRDASGVPTGVPGSAVVLRTISNTYYNPALTSTSGNVYAKRSLATGTPLILSALQQSTIGPAITQLSYDGQSYGIAPTVGNVTSQSVWVNVDNKWITSSQTYDAYGNLATKTDPRGKVTQFFYDDSTHALPNRVVVDPQNGTGTQTNTTAYDFATSQVTSQTDPNGNITTVDYTNQLLAAVDPFARPGITYGPTISSQRQRVTTTYLDNARQVIQATDLTTPNDKLQKTRSTTDQLGRVTLTEHTEDGTNYTISSSKVYQQMGKITFSANPKRSGAATTDGWSRTTHDTAGRVVEVAYFSGAAQPPSTGTNGNWTGSATTSYDANFTTVTDQAGKLRRSVVDALGRLVRVDEPDASNNLGTTSSPVQSTSYTYNVLGDLLTISQGAQTRTLTYDTLSRLRTANNPESGTLTYTYDDNGNLLTKQDARSVTTTMTYDALNRPTAKTYSDGTPRVDYFYDTQSLPAGAPTFNRGHAKGRLVAVTYSGGSAGTYRGYDERGLIVRQYQQTDSINYLVEAAYRLNGSIQSQTYPSVPGAADRRTVTYTPDNAGRLASLSAAATTYAPAASVGSVTYTAPGTVSSETYGNTLVHAVNFNSRIQPSEIKLGTAGNPVSVVSIAYNYGSTNNNGNVQSITYSGGGLSYTQSFGYDSLNRLTTATENSGANWSQTNGYDRYGNRWISLGGGSQNLYFTASNNRITGSSYDAVGNLLNDGAHSYTYNAENKISKVDNVNAYVYDGEGQRVRKFIGENLRFVYGLAGELLMEFNGATGTLTKEYIYGTSGLLATIEPTAVNSNGTRYTTSDRLGSPRVVTNSGAAVVSRHDYKPFGEELGAGVGGRTTGMGFPGTSDGVRQKFTGKERDTETGLDYSGARYYTSGQGRFTGADPLLSSGIIYDPQTWNRYSYALNNPLKYTDPLGLYVFSPDLGGNKTDDELRAEAKTEKEKKQVEQIIKKRDQIRNALKAAREALQNPTLTPAQRAKLERAVNSYGEFNDGKNDNVVVGLVAKKGDAPNAALGNKDGLIHVEFDLEAKNRNLTVTIAHEGSHVADYQAYLAALVNEPEVAAVLNLQLYFTEDRAYTVSSYMAQALGLKSYYPEKMGADQLWNSGWKENEREVKRSTGISRTNPWGFREQGGLVTPNFGPRMSTITNKRY